MDLKYGVPVRKELEGLVRERIQISLESAAFDLNCEKTQTSPFDFETVEK